MYLPAAAGGRGPSGDPRGLHHRGTHSVSVYFNLMNFIGMKTVFKLPKQTNINNIVEEGKKVTHNPVGRIVCFTFSPSRNNPLLHNRNVFY